MKIEFTNSVDDIKECWLMCSKTNTAMKKRRIFYKWFYSISVILIYIFLIIYYESTVILFEKDNLKIILVLAIILLGSIPLWDLYLLDKLLDKLIKKTAEKCIKNQPELIEPQILTLDNNKLFLETTGERIECPISHVGNVIEHNGKIYIFKNSYIFIAIVPIEVFPNDKDKELFLDMLNRPS